MVYANYKSMKHLTRQIEAAAPTIKERLLIRFGRARDKVGANWRDALAKSDPFFNTKIGSDYMRSVGQATSNNKRGNVDRIERVTIGLEKLAGIKSRPIV